MQKAGDCQSVNVIPPALWPWPPNSPRLNPVDYAVWEILQERPDK